MKIYNRMTRKIVSVWTVENKYGIINLYARVKARKGYYTIKLRGQIKCDTVKLANI